MSREAPNNLPAPVTSFVGRAVETQQVLDLLASRARLVTLTGTGGVGKTRLAQEIGWRLVASNLVDDGVWWVELAPLTDARRVAQAVATTLGLHEESGTPFADLLASAVRSRHLVLVLDNCEHLIQACAELAHDLLRACPNLRLLATSREPLKTQGEVERHVSPLACPDPTQAPTAERVRDSDAVRLFAERAAGASQRFQLTDQTAAAVARVCQQLDGIPLALELAAARVRVLSVEQIAARLDTNFAMLASGDRTAPLRQQTLDAAVAWSYDLLTGDEQRLFTRVAVFRGSWTLEAAEAICGDPDGSLVLDTLSRLVEKSLVVVDDGPSGASVYRMPETIRQFAAARLIASGEMAVLRERHFRFYVELGLEAEQALRVARVPWASRRRWMERLQLELANFRAAWHWPLDGDGDPRQGLKLAAALFAMFWTGIGMLAEGIECYCALLERDRQRYAGPSPERAWALATGCKLAAQYAKDDLAVSLADEYRALPFELQAARASSFVDNALGLVALHHGDLELARRRVLAALQTAPAAGDTQCEALFYSYLGGVDEADGALGAAEANYRESVDRARAIDFPIAVGLGLAGLARLAHARGESASARGLYQQAQAALGDMGAMPQIAELLADRGHLELDCGNWREAAVHFGESLELAIRVGTRVAILGALEGLGLALATCQTLAAVRHTGLRLLGARLSAAPASPAVVAALSRAELSLGAERTTRLVKEGRILGLDDATGVARAALAELSRVPLPASETSAVHLSRREREVLELLARGATNRQIADALVIAERTAEMHVSNVLAKLDLTGRAQVAAWVADQRGVPV